MSMPNTTEEAKEIDQLLAQVQHRIEVLQQALAVLIETVDGSLTGDPYRVGTPEAVSRQMSAFPPRVRPWRLVSSGRCLVTPTGEKISLGGAQYQLLHQIFTSPGFRVTFAELEAGGMYGHTGTQRSVPGDAVKMTLSRLRRKLREYEIEFPLFSIRGTGLHFMGPAEVCER